MSVANTVATGIAAEQIRKHDEVCDIARRQLAATAKSAEEVRELGLMLGLFTPDTHRRTETSVTTASPFHNDLQGFVPQA